jgi:acetone carboxylase gamma subunit
MRLPMRCHVCQTRFPPPLWGVATECPKCGEVIDVNAASPKLPMRNAFEVLPKPPAPVDRDRSEPPSS